MTNIFKQVIVPWLLALLLAWVLVIVWLHNETRNQQMQQIQQLAVTVNYAVQANLPVNDDQQLANQLRQIHYSSTLAVQHIAAYNSQLQLIASSTSPAPVAVLNSAPTAYQVRTLPDGNQLAVLPVSVGMTVEQSTVASQIPDNGYVAVVFSTEQTWMLRLIPLALLTVAMAVGLMLSLGLIKRGQSRLATDAELLVHNLRRLQNARQQCQITEPLVPALKPVQQAFNDLASSLDQNQQATEQLVQQLNQRLQQVNAQLTELEQQRQRLTTFQQLQQRQIRHWFEQSMLLWQRREQLQPAQLQRLIQMHMLTGHYQFSDKDFKGPPVRLVSWLGKHLNEFNELIPSATVVLDWQEHPDNLAYSAHICEKTLKSLIQALIMLCLRGDDVSKVNVEIKLEKGEHQSLLRLTVSCNGNGIPGHCQELLKNTDLLDMQWSDADVALLNAIQATDADFSSQSLDGLGCILQLTIPVLTEQLSAVKAMQHLLIFDADEERIQQRCSALSGVASQISKCSKLSELEQLTDRKVVDLVILFLPATADSADWQKIIDNARQQSTLLCYTSPELMSAWQQKLPEVLVSHQFCLAAVQAATEQLPKPVNLQHILVVDDNETNLAFVQVLLKNKPLVLHTATSAIQVFSLCQQQRFDMILLDIQLPDMSGVDIAKKLRQIPQYRQVPIVAFTAHAMPAEIETYREAGMDDIVFKPLEPARLDSLLARFSLTTNQN
ncbi:CheY chemotaxis protein or a CheY-like REC (receiver) domain [Arsukibacterium tuosuense]|uniref:CheY chemotaxis protein or a CheY-like REC (Receiver) domain n=1 Tax=Arsukibacterium tuosuense TaxID=1323745 RepID=A0A285IY11_9GAMM|nr:response regulator [Arsukibacterium tuosuense]SNY52862.1 CheY chemotaxis protein or a CheY-like REC (receiver) domain [Arsukibacterium tuosuense]